MKRTLLILPPLLLGLAFAADPPAKFPESDSGAMLTALREHASDVNPKTCLPKAVSMAPESEPPAKFPEPYDSEKSRVKPQSPQEAAKGFKVPPGFHVEVFAAEPDVRNPIAMAWDTKGRLWVAENHTYAELPKRFDLTLKDRVLIFHDKNGDGKNIERKVFCDNVQKLTGVEVGLGGVWLMCPPQLLFIPDKNGDDIPDGPPQVILEGFDVPAENHHNFANGIKWGPDGWLWGRCGASAPGKVRRPDEGPEKAVPLHGGIWRYHPHRKVFEVLCHGTTNPWGHDWDAYGECFFTNSVNGHVWHMIPGAHFRRPHTISPNPLVYEPMEMIADHWHFDIGKGWNQKAVNDSRNVDATIDALGGGHAHVGCMIYNGDQWPKEYRGKLFTLNLHGRRINVERLERSGSSYVAKREPDMFFASDPCFRGIDLSTGPDGSVYVLDWNDAGECHEHSGVLRSTGRIYRLRYGDKKKWEPADLTKVSRVDLVRMQSQSNEWYVRHARLLYREIVYDDYYVKGTPTPAIEYYREDIDLLKEYLKAKEPRICYNAMMMIEDHGASLFDMDWKSLLKHQDERIRSHAVRLYNDYVDDIIPIGRSESSVILIDTATSTVRSKSHGLRRSELAEYVNDPSARFRLSLASELQRIMPVAKWNNPESEPDRLTVATALSQHIADASDPNIPLLIWYGLIPIINESPEKVIDLAAKSKIPLLRKWTTRRFAEIMSEKPNCLNDLLLKTANAEESVRRDIVIGMSEGLRGIRKAKKPAAWNDDYVKGIMNGSQIQNVRTLNVIFGDGRALEEVRTVALDDKADLATRHAALLSLIDADPAAARSVCEKLLKTRFLNVTALKGLVRFDEPAVGRLIADQYRSFHPSERHSVIEALSSRPSFAAVLLDEIAKGKMARSELSAAQARTIRGFDKPELAAKLSQVWGELRDTPKDKQDLMAKLKADLTTDALKSADKSAGRVIYAKTCASCHKLYGTGEAIGPDLTGAGRKDLDYLLNKIVDPNAIVTKDFQMTSVRMKDGRTLNGIVVATAPKTITLQMEKEKVVIANDDIESQKPTKLSLMPEGQLLTMTPADIRNLFAYLQSDSQVELPK